MASKEEGRNAACIRGCTGQGPCPAGWLGDLEGTVLVDGWEVVSWGQ